MVLKTKNDHLRGGRLHYHWVVYFTQKSIFNRINYFNPISVDHLRLLTQIRSFFITH
jgi:hypothetical protein